MVAVGTLFSAFWILSANSWMHTPVGYTVNAAGQFVPQDWWTIIFNPSFPYRLVHTVLAAYLTTALVVGAVGAWHLLRDRAERGRARDVLDGDGHRGGGGPVPGLGGRPARPQYARAPARQGDGDGGAFQSHPDGAPLILFGMPDQEAARCAMRSPFPRRRR